LEWLDCGETELQKQGTLVSVGLDRWRCYLLGFGGPKGLVVAGLTEGGL
jgi:hypothetical protein